MEQKLCINCANSRMVNNYPQCVDNRNLVQSLVDGRERSRLGCEYLRDVDMPTFTCGPAARWFVPRSKPLEGAK